MGLLKLGDTTIVLEKVIAYELIRPRMGPGGTEDGPPTMRIMLEGGKDVSIAGRSVIANFTKAMKDLYGT